MEDYRLNTTLLTVQESYIDNLRVSTVHNGWTNYLILQMP